MTAKAADIVKPPRPAGGVYIGRENVVGFPKGSLVMQLAHGEGRVQCSIGPDGKPTFRITDAEGEVVAPEHR